MDIDSRIHLGGEEENVLTVVSLLKDPSQDEERKHSNSINTDLRAFFEAKEDPPSSSALFLSLIVASEG